MIFSVKCPSWNMLPFGCQAQVSAHQEGQKRKQVSPQVGIFVSFYFYFQSQDKNQ